MLSGGAALLGGPAEPAVPRATAPRPRDPSHWGPATPGTPNPPQFEPVLEKVRVPRIGPAG